MDRRRASVGAWRGPPVSGDDAGLPLASRRGKNDDGAAVAGGIPGIVAEERMHEIDRASGSPRALSLAAASAVGRGQGEVRHQLARRGRAWRLLPGRRRRHLREIRPRCRDRAGRAAGRQRHPARLRQARLLHGLKPDRGVRRGEAERSDGRGRRALPERPADGDVASRRRARQIHGPGQGARLYRQGRAVLSNG